jgi:hypothetical protein
VKAAADNEHIYWLVEQLHPTHNCRSAMILRFLKPVIRDVLQTTPLSHSDMGLSFLIQTPIPVIGKVALSTGQSNMS